jgi:hypothetical protein
LGDSQAKFIFLRRGTRSDVDRVRTVFPEAQIDNGNPRAVCCQAVANTSYTIGRDRLIAAAIAVMGSSVCVARDAECSEVDQAVR